MPQRSGGTSNCTVKIKNLQIIYLFIIDECTSCISRYVYVRNRRASSLLGSDLERVAWSQRLRIFSHKSVLYLRKLPRVCCLGFTNAGRK